jgi:hypothetical protein
MLYSIISMNSSQYKRVKERSLPISFSLLLILIISSCQKSEDYFDNTASYPQGWMSSELSNIVAYNVKDSLTDFINTSIAPLGTVIDGNFGTMRTSFYISYQTTLTSKSFSFASIDSAVLVMPYYTSYAKYGAADKPFSIEVYEMTEAFESITGTKKISYAHNSSPIGSKSNFIPNVTDSVYDGVKKSPAAIRIPLAASFAQKIIAPGSYADDAAFQAVVKGIYVRSTATTSTNGFVMLSIESDNKIKIYGKNAAGESIVSEFTTGGTNCTTINEYLHDNASLAASATTSANMTTGDNTLYNAGLTGYYNKLKLPDFRALAADKNIFKVELTLYRLDSGYFASSPGILFVDSVSGREIPIPDEYYAQSFVISTKDTVIGGNKCKEYKYNIGLLANRINSNASSNRIRTNTLNIYSAPLSILRSSTSKLSTFLPSRLVLGGSTHAARPRIKIYYTK